MAQRVDEASNLVFVQLIEQEPGIYDKRHPDYARRDTTDSAWERISHETKESGSSATKKRQYYLHDALQFMIPHITKNRHHESNIAAPHTEEGTAFCGETEEEVKEASGNITPSNSPTVIQASCRQSNRDECKQPLLGKRRRLTALDQVDTSFMNYVNQDTQSTIPDPDAQFLHSLLPDMKLMTPKQKRAFKIGALNLMNEILEDAGSDQQSSTD
ncbi:hypothetical protein B7P43_G10196 [Cryptotermes secundus]|uniref:BESS domain-containing protein n=1 Tax=Cryptotermes secundus TaxID=105785 RepID=A0A2J7RDC8_9NEOP|nr:hypothetical protein B7P43_G10196 [Cryptotermes secundus]